MTLFSSVDAFWVGTKIGPAALAAVSTSLFWIWMIISLAEMIGVGLTAVAARRHGERRGDEARASRRRHARVRRRCLALSWARSDCTICRRCSRSCKRRRRSRRLVSIYLGDVSCFGTPLIYGFFAIDAAFRAAGDTRTPFVLLLASVAITLVLDPVLILGLGPFPRLGIAGAAIATIATRGAAFVMGVVIAWRRGLLRIGRVRADADSVRLSSRSADGDHRCDVQPDLRFSHAHDDAIRNAGTRGARHRSPRRELVVHDRRRIRCGDRGDRRAEPRRGSRGSCVERRAGWPRASARCSASVACVLELTSPREFASLFTSDPAVIAESAKYLADCRDLTACRLLRDRAGGRARRRGRNGAADACVDRHHGVAHSARRLGCESLGECRHLVGASP